MNRLRVSLAALLALLCLVDARVFAQPRSTGTTPAPAERRTALVIGNSDYPAAPLRNPGNDARKMGQALLELGFDVVLQENVGQSQMRRLIVQFGDRIREGGVGLFYYAGHGMQVGGRNYMIPVDADVKSEAEVEVDGVDVAAVLARMETARNKLNLVILDACRDNPFIRRFRSSAKGLASIDAPVGTLIAYATAPGSLAFDGSGPTSYYTGELVDAIRTPGLRVEEVFKRVRQAVRVKTQGKQVPWEASSLEGEFVFVERREPSVRQPAPPPITASPPPTPSPAPTVAAPPSSTPPPPIAASPTPAAPRPSTASPPTAASPTPSPSTAAVTPDTVERGARERAATLVRATLLRRGDLMRFRGDSTVLDRYEIHDVSGSKLSVTVHRVITGGGRTLDGKHGTQRIDTGFDKLDPKSTRFSKGGRFAARNAVELCFESRHVAVVSSDNIAFPDERYVCFELQAASDAELDQVRTALELLSGKALAPIK